MTDERKRVVHVERQLPCNDAEAWDLCVQRLLGPVYLGTREADLAKRRQLARLLAAAALRAAGEDRMADGLERDA